MQALEEAKESIHEVFGKMKGIKEKADKSEEMVSKYVISQRDVDHFKRDLFLKILQPYCS